MKPSIGEIRDTSFSTSSPIFTSLPGSVGVPEDTLSALSRFLRPGVSTNSNPLEKMLTPVEERAAEIEGGNSLSDDEDNIITSTSLKLDGILFPRSGSQLSNQGGLHWAVGSEGDSEVGSTRDTVSILSSGYGTPPRHILNSSNSMDILDHNSISEQFREEITQILDDQDLHQKDSSQGSDDSSTFSESVQALLSHSPATSPRVSLTFSSTQGTPVRTMSDSRMFTRQSNSLGHSHGRKRPPFDRSSATAVLSSPYSSSAHSSTSRTSQGSYSDSFREDYRGREREQEQAMIRQNKKSTSDKWERYERSQSMEVSDNNKPPQVDITVQYAQDNNLTTDTAATDKNTKEESEDEHSQQMPDNEKVSQDVYRDINVEEGAEQHKNKGSVASILLQEIHRHADSGIDDTGSPDAKGARSMVKSLSAGDAEESHLSETLSPRTYAVVFTSRESGLAESPDPEGMNDDEQSSVAEYHVHVQKESDDEDDVHVDERECDEENVKEEESLEQDSQQQLVPSEKSGDIENLGEDAPMEESYSPKNGAPSSLLGKQPSLFSMNSDHTLNVGPDITEFEDTDYNEMESAADSSSDRAPRSLEGPSFSRYARVPIHNTDHKGRHHKVSDSPVFDTRADWRLRTSSLDDLSETSVSPAKIGDRERRALSETRSYSTAVSINASPQHHSQSYQRAGGLKSSRSTGTFTEMQDKLDDPLYKNSSDGDSLRLEKKHKKGIGSALAKKFKPAFRKFRITPSTSESSTPSLVLSDDDSRSTPSHNGASTQTSPQARSPLHYGDLHPTRRVRMRSPDLSSPTKNSVSSMRRSQSSEDILESRRQTYYDEEVDEKPKSRGGIFNKVGSWRNKHKAHGRGSPVILVDFQQYNQYSVYEGSSNLEPSPSSDSNPKNGKKRNRHPQFV